MAYPTFTLDEYNDLIRAIALGAFKVKYEDREVTYRSLKEMNSVRILMEKSLGLAPATPARKVITASKGL